MTPLRAAVNAAAQQAIRECHDYRIAHDGHKSKALDAAYEAAERMMDAVEEYERIRELAHDGMEDAEYAPPVIVGGVLLPDVPLADPGDHHVYPAGVGL